LQEGQNGQRKKMKRTDRRLKLKMLKNDVLKF